MKRTHFDGNNIEAGFCSEYQSIIREVRNTSKNIPSCYEVINQALTGNRGRIAVLFSRIRKI